MTDEQKKEVKEASFKFIKTILPYLATFAISVVGTLLGTDNVATIAVLVGSALVGVNHV